MYPGELEKSNDLKIGFPGFLDKYPLILSGVLLENKLKTGYYLALTILKKYNEFFLETIKVSLSFVILNYW